MELVGPSDLPKSVSSRFTEDLISNIKVKSHKGRQLSSISGFYMLKHMHAPSMNTATCIYHTDTERQTDVHACVYTHK